MYHWGDDKMRWFVIAPITASLIIFAVAEATGEEALLWILLGVLAGKALFVAFSWPLLLTVLIRVPITRPGVRVLLIWFLLEMLVISAGFAIPLHILEPPYLRVLPSFFLMAFVAILYYELAAGDSWGANMIPRFKWIFVLLILGAVAYALYRQYA